MLSAAKHLYRFVERLSREAVEMLRCAQHDNVTHSSTPYSLQLKLVGIE
jgi:hypothetical protein